MTTTANELQTKGDAARRAARELARTPTDVKNRALEGIADSLLDRADEIIAANVIYVEGGKEAGL
ncbi:MAG: gamma-glutamyl-phosphate reductase, partial [Chloroflexi bacterium]|nr:gamma-glutamyl-phosphate reductase [Chloroflexota bacterium]